jgi:hypothetical protein
MAEHGMMSATGKSYMLIVIMLNVIMLSVVAPFLVLPSFKFKSFLFKVKLVEKAIRVKFAKCFTVMILAEWNSAL